MISSTDVSRIENATAYDSTGDKVGKVDQIFLDDHTGEPTFVTVATGLFGTSQSFIPLQRASLDGDDLRLGYEKDKIKDAPRVEADQHITPAEESEIYRYYGLGAAQTGGEVGTETHAHGSDDDVAVTRSEERLDVGTESHETGRVRLRKYTTSETETVSVPVTKEKLSVERNPVEGRRSSSGPLGEGEDQVEEVTLREERPVVDKETVDVEEVRVGKERVTEQERVSDEVRKEHVDVEGEGAAGEDTRRA